MNKLLAYLGILACVSTVAVASELVEGTDYVRIQVPRSTESPSKIEVVEFFYYACPHCKDFNPTLTKWVTKLPKDVVFKRIPVSFKRAALVNHAKLYYALEITGDLKRLDNEVFAALHDQKINLADEAILMDWISKKGVDRQKFGDAYKSFGVDSKVSRGQQIADAYGINGVPALTIDGRYRMTGNNIKGHEELLAQTNQMIKQARAENGKKK